jgi:uncharacterized phiE125 gp8 family phage protein
VGLQLINPATAPLVALADARTICKVDGSAEDARLQMLLSAAIIQVEDFLGKALGAQQWKLVLDAFSDAIELPRGPVISLDQVSYVGLDGLARDCDSDFFTLDLVSDPQWIVRNTDATWPDLLDAVNAVAITFTTGFTGTRREAAAVRLAVLGLVRQWFDDGIVGAMPAAVVELLRPYRRIII